VTANDDDARRARAFQTLADAIRQAAREMNDSARRVESTMAFLQKAFEVAERELRK
jgi:predicted neutral ceramidase superfamily lipid hydrolase